MAVGGPRRWSPSWGLSGSLSRHAGYGLGRARPLLYQQLPGQAAWHKIQHQGQNPIPGSRCCRLDIVLPRDPGSWDWARMSPAPLCAHLRRWGGIGVRGFAAPLIPLQSWAGGFNAAAAPRAGMGVQLLATWGAAGGRKGLLVGGKQLGICLTRDACGLNCRPGLLLP